MKHPSLSPSSENHQSSAGHVAGSRGGRNIPTAAGAGQTAGLPEQVQHGETGGEWATCSGHLWGVGRQDPTVTWGLSVHVCLWLSKGTVNVTLWLVFCDVYVSEGSGHWTVSVMMSVDRVYVSEDSDSMWHNFLCLFLFASVPRWFVMFLYTPSHTYILLM